MPIYEYRCFNCKRRVSILWRTLADAESGEPRCPRCGGTNLARLISRVAVARSEDAHMDDLMDPGSLGGLDENDPKSIARWMRKMSQEMGDDAGGELDEVVDRLESGQTPDQIEKELPDLGLGGESGSDIGSD